MLKRIGLLHSYQIYKKSRYLNFWTTSAVWIFRAPSLSISALLMCLFWCTFTYIWLGSATLVVKPWCLYRIFVLGNRSICNQNSNNDSNLMLIFTSYFSSCVERIYGVSSESIFSFNESPPKLKNWYLNLPCKITCYSALSNVLHPLKSWIFSSIH